MKRMLFLVCTLGALLALASAVGGCAPAAPPTPTPAPKVVAPTPTPAPPTPTPVPYYAGKTLRWIVGFAPGGGFDTYTRTIARHIGKHIPGNPTSVVENMTGAGSLIAANYVYKSSKPDGLTVGNFIEGLPLQQVLGRKEIEFDARKYKWLGGPVKEHWVCAVVKDNVKDRGFKTMADVIGAPKPLVVGGTAPGSQTDDFPRALQVALGANLKLVDGYAGTADIRRAADAGELDGGCWSWESIKVTWRDRVERGELLYLVQQAAKKHKDLPDVPLATELAKTAEARQLILLATGVSVMSKPYGVHPDTPVELVTILRKGFADALKDPELLAEAKKANLDIEPTTAEEIEKAVADMFALPPDIIKKGAELFLPK